MVSVDQGTVVTVSDREPADVSDPVFFGTGAGFRGVAGRGDQSATIRFTARRPGSIWSAVNVAKVEALVAAGLMEVPSGRRPRRSGWSPDDARSVGLSMNVPDMAAFRTSWTAKPVRRR
jgi:hypothetical protein